MGRAGKILVVDDDEAVRLRVRDLLETGGRCEVSEAVSGAGCLELAPRLTPDLVLLDLMMPGMSGLEVCTRLRADARTREIPIIVLSAADADSALDAALAAGAEDFISKPLPARELRSKVETILGLNRYHSLRQERDRLRWLFEHSREPLVRITHAGVLREANRQAREIFGFPAAVDGAAGAEAEASRVPDALEIIGRHHRADPPDAFDRLRERKAFPDGAFSLHRPETSLLSARWYRVEVHEDADTPSADILLKLTDHSERVQLELESWTFQRLIAHKLRTPMNGVGPLLDILLEEPGYLANGDARDIALGARESARRLEQTLISIMRYHQVICGLGSVSEGGVARPWDDVLREAAAEAGIAPRRLRVVGDASPLLPPGLGEPMRMVLAELAGNYLKFADVEHGGLEARFRVVPGEAPELRLFAPGPALAPELVARLGRPYWQAERRFTGEVPGVGLGLATCRLLLSSLGGGLILTASDRPPGLVSTVVLPFTP